MNHTTTRRMRLTAGFAAQTAAANQRPADHPISEMRWFPVREPVSGNRYTVLRLRTRSGLIGWGECAHAPEQDTNALDKEWIGRSAKGCAHRVNWLMIRSLCWLSSFISSSRSRGGGYSLGADGRLTSIGH